MACFFEASEEPGFEIYEDSTATDGEVNGSVPRTQLPSESTSADDTDSALAAAIKLVTLNDKTPVAWVTDGCPAALIDRNKLTCRFFINTGAIRCCCYFVPHGNDIEVENDSDVTIHISNVGQSYEVERDKGTRRLPPGVWLLATEVGAHAAVLRIASCADTAQGAPADVLPNKRLCSGSQHRLQSVHAHDVDTPPERCERGLQRPAREGLTGTISGICYRKQFRKSSGGVITMSHSATERQLPLTSKARVWESCVKACRGLDHPHILKLLDSDARYLSITTYSSIPALLQTDANGYFQGDDGSMIVQVTAALVYLHSKGITHYNVSARNILLQSDGRYRLSLFAPRTPASHELLTTPGYLPPEALGSEPIRDQKGDIFALGIVALYTKGYIPLPESRPWWDEIGYQQRKRKELKAGLTWRDMVERGRQQAKGDGGCDYIIKALAVHEKRPTSMKFCGMLTKAKLATAPEGRLRAALRYAGTPVITDVYEE